MGEIYSYLVDAGFAAEYLDHCTLLDLDLFQQQTNARRKREGWKPV